MPQQNKPLIGRTKHGEFTLDQIADMQPGLGMLMPQISDRYWIMYYAAQGGNWGLAAYQLHEMTGLLKLGATTRPKWGKYINAFIKGHISAMQAAINEEDFSTFDIAYRSGINAANVYHVETGHGEIIWELPPDPPKHLSMQPKTS